MVLFSHCVGWVIVIENICRTDALVSNDFAMFTRTARALDASFLETNESIGCVALSAIGTRLELGTVDAFRAIRLRTQQWVFALAIASDVGIGVVADACQIQEPRPYFRPCTSDAFVLRVGITALDGNIRRRYRLARWSVLHFSRSVNDRMVFAWIRRVLRLSNRCRLC